MRIAHNRISSLTFHALSNPATAKRLKNASPKVPRWTPTQLRAAVRSVLAKYSEVATQNQT